MPRLSQIALIALSAWATGAGAADDAWSRSYDPATRIRFIPLELILGAPWDGARKIAMPKGSFTEGVPRDPSTWVGPVEWRHPDNGELLQVYERMRRGVGQRFAIRKDGTAIGRVSDTRFGISSCEEEAKYPLGEWRHGETRRFEYRCTYGGGRSRAMVSTITLEEADFNYGGVGHSILVHWVYSRKDDGVEVDNRRYVFSPDRGAVSVR